MKELEQKLEQHFKAEADQFMFTNLHFDSRLTNKVFQAVDSHKRVGFKEWLASGRKKWVYGTAVAAVIMMLAMTPMFLNILRPENTGDSLPTPSGSAGSSLSTLKTVVVQTPEEAKQRFGPNLHVPGYIPEGYQLTKIQATGTEGNIATQVIFTFTSGDQELTLLVDKKPASFNLDPFGPVKVNGVDGYLNAAPGITELYWLADGIQFAIIGPISAEEAIKMAESLEII